MTAQAPAPGPFREPPHDCPLCPRLAEFRAANRAAHPEWHNAPVASFGPLDARLLIVGLAPGLRGANATGRPFTGDFAGDLLYRTLLKFGFAKGAYGRVAADGLTLDNARITNAARCVPPQNRPTGPEIRTCGDFLNAEILAMENLVCIVTLGAIAHNSVKKALGLRTRDAPFGHAVAHDAPNGITILGSYHCSRLNTNTGRLTTEMFEGVFARARDIIG